MSVEVMPMTTVTPTVHCCHVPHRRSSGVLDGVVWQLLTKVSEETVGAIFKGQTSVRDRTDGLSRDVYK
jgi:hypothetical protein